MNLQPLAAGEPAPWFVAPSPSNPKYHFNSVAGRYVLLSFFGSSQEPGSQVMLGQLSQYRHLLNDHLCSFFGVSIDPEDATHHRLVEQVPGIRYFWDFEQSISQQFGIVDPDTDAYVPCTYLLDERLRVLGVLPLYPNPETHLATLMETLATLPALPEGPATVQAPVLVVPRIFEPALCEMLIDYYHQQGGESSGFMRDVNGKTVQISDPSFKRRRDAEITDQDLRNAAMFRIHDRLVPEIAKAFQFQATRIERHIVCCYDSTSGGFFRPHRDNTTKGTAHRRFAVSLNLNTGDYEGGLLRFPEFGRQTYEAPRGGAVVFSCSLLHEATPVTTGRRYAYLPFLYDEAAAQIRDQNQQFVGNANPTPSPQASEKTAHHAAKGVQPAPGRSRKR